MAKYNDVKKDGKLFAIKDERGDWIANPQGWLRTYRSAKLAKKRVPEYSNYPMECKVVELVPKVVE